MKTERALKHDACKADSRYHGWCLVNSMNLLISSIHQKDIFLGEKFLERCEALLTDEDANSSASISMLIIKCHLYWYMNRRDFVLEHIGELIGHLNLISPNDLVQSIQELIFLLKDMEDARAKRGKLCIAIIDIDHFKTHNDTYGHIHGDSCLKLTATALMSCVGEKGRVYRFGGDEFVILLDSSELNSVKAIAEAIKQYFQSSDSVEVTDGIPGITLSQGYAISTVDSTTTKETLFSRADEALYSVKEGGRNNYCIYEE